VHLYTSAHSLPFQFDSVVKLSKKESGVSFRPCQEASSACQCPVCQRRGRDSSGGGGGSAAAAAAAAAGTDLLGHNPLAGSSSGAVGPLGGAYGNER